MVIYLKQEKAISLKNKDTIVYRNVTQMTDTLIGISLISLLGEGACQVLNHTEDGRKKPYRDSTSWKSSKDQIKSQYS